MPVSIFNLPDEAQASVTTTKIRDYCHGTTEALQIVEKVVNANKDVMRMGD